MSEDGHEPMGPNAPVWCATCGAPWLYVNLGGVDPYALRDQVEDLRREIAALAARVVALEESRG